MEDVPRPFTQSRLRSFTGRLDSSIDAQMSIANAMALAPGVLFAPLEKLDCTRPPQAAQQVTQQQSSAGSGQLPESALSEINALKSEIAGIEALLGHLKKVLPSVQKGRGADTAQTEEQLRNRAQSHHRRIKELQGGQDATSTGISNAAAWSSTLRVGERLPSTKPENWGLDRGGTPVTVTPVGRGEAIMLEAALDEALPEGALTAKYAAPALSAKAAAARAAGPALQADIARATVQLGRAPRASTTSNASVTFTPTIPANLRDSSVLQGGATVGGSGNSFTGSSAKQSAAQLLLSSQNMEDDIEMLSMTAKEAARQVAAHCAERARVILKIDVRYQEAFRAFRAILEAVHAANAALVVRLEQAHSHAQDQASVIASLEETSDSQSQHLDAKDTELAELQSMHEALQWDTQQKIASLSSQNTILADEVEHYSRRLEESEMSFHDQLEERMASATSQVASLTDERDDLHQRLRFLEKQNAVLRHENSRVPSISHTEMQTDPVEWAAADEEEEVEDAGLGQQVQVGGLDWLPTDAALGKHQTKGAGSLASVKQRRKKPKHLGGFLGMLTVDKPGRVRGPMWTANTIAQIYQDKTIHDAVCDRESNPRSPICNYVHEWHLHKYGLRSLADASLVDLIASTRHHQKTSVRIGWFAHFTGLDESSDPMDSLQHLSFYLFVLQQLMWPSSLQMAFPETSSHDAATAVAGAPSDVPVMIKGQQAIEATKAIFRYLNDPDAATAFIAKHIEPAPVIPSLLPPTEAVGVGGGDMGAVDARAGGGPSNYLVPLDPLVKGFMTEFHKRIDKNIAHLNALFKAGDLDRDGNITYDEFVTLIRLAAPDVTERLLTKAYTEAVRHQPSACYLVPCSTFVEVARNFGFDRWKVDASVFASVLPGMGPAGGAALLAEGGMPALLSARKGLNRPTSSGSQVPNQQQTLSPPGSADGSKAGGSPDKQATGAGDLLRGIERFDTERGIKACLEACLEGMRPSLEELMADARARLGSRAHPTLQHLECQLEHFHSALAKARGPPDPLSQPNPSLTARMSSTTQAPNSAQPDPLPVSSALASHRSATHAKGGGKGPASSTASHTYPPANAAHAWLCFRLLYESLAAAYSSRTLASRASSMKRANSSGSGSRSPLSHSPRSGSPSSAAGQQRRMLIVPALTWRGGPASSVPPPTTTSGLQPLGNTSLKLRSMPSLPRPPHLLSPLGLDSPQSPQRLQTTYPQELLLAHDADPLQPETPGHQQQQQQQHHQQQQATQQQQQQWDSAQAARMEAMQREAMQKQQQEQQQLQEMARALRASAQQQQLRAVPPQVMHLDPSRHRQQQQQLHVPPTHASGEFEFAPILKK